MGLNILYSKAYKLKDIKEFSGWQSLLMETITNPQEIDAMGDDDFLFVHHDYSITVGPTRGHGTISGQPSPQWKSFCDECLRFHERSV